MNYILLMLGSLGLGSIGIWNFYRKKYAIGIFDFLWSIICFVCLDGVIENTESYTWILIFTMIFFVNVGYIIGRYRIVLHKRKKLLWQSEMCNWSLLRKLLIASMIILLFYSIKSVFNYGLNLNLIRVNNNSNSEERVFTGLLDTIIFYGFAVPMIYVGALVIAYNFSMKNKIPKKVLFIISISIVAYIFTTGGRSLLLRIVLFMCAAILWRLHKWGGRGLKIRSLVIGGVFIYLALNVMTVLRNAEKIYFLEQVFEYIKGAILHMNYHIKNTNTDSLYFGYVTYGGFLYYPVKILQNVFGVDIDTSNEIMYFLQNYRMLSIGNDDVIYYNALLPNAYYYYYDMGYAGVVIFSILLGWFTRQNEMKYMQPQFLKFVIWATSIYAMAYSCFGGVLWSFSYPTALIYCFILKKICFIGSKGNEEWIC